MALKYRSAEREDLERLVSLLSNDPLGIKREDATLPLNDAYIAAFNAIDADPNNELLVVEFDGLIIGMLQLTFIPNLTFIGSWRCQVEGVRIREDFRGRGFGEQMLQHAIEQARLRDCCMVQLATNKSRENAIKFYENLGFKATHEGFKLSL